MRRGDVVLVNLDPARKPEAANIRPCVIVSNDGANMTAVKLGHGTLTIVPGTRNTDWFSDDFQVLIDDPYELREAGLPEPTKLQAEQVRTVSLSRVVNTIGRLSPNALAAVDNALRFHLSL